MSIDIDYNNRQLVPRLLSTRKSNILSLDINYNIKNSFKMNSFEKHNYSKLKEEWKKEKNTIIAIEILTYGIIHEELSIDEDALLYASERKNLLNEFEKEIFNLALHKKVPKNLEEYCCDDTETIRYRIRELKAVKKYNLINPFLWCDIGYYYTIIGEKNKAKKAFLTAISLNNSNRFVVRSVARFFLHLEEYDFAHRILTDSPRIKEDPGILSAEIAISELMEKKSRFVSHGLAIIDDANISLIEKNELIGQVATLEFTHGKRGKARKLVEKCLGAPNENILAQFEFISNSHRIDNEFDSKKFNVMCQYEALARAYFDESNFKEALTNSKLWLDFQPFSNKPAILASYIAGTVVNDYSQAIEITQNALTISPDSNALKNNLAYSLAKSNRVEEAYKIIKTIKLNCLSKYETAVISATLGLISYKNNDLLSAKRGYDNAIQYFRTTDNQVALARALYNYAIILKEFDYEKSKACNQEAYNLSIENNIVELKYLLKNNDITTASTCATRRHLSVAEEGGT